MQTSMLPMNVCNEIDKRTRRFLWGNLDDNRKIHLVAWEDVCKPKEDGGLGLRQARKQNIAFMMKLGWGLIKRRDALWVNFVREKYKCGSDIIPQVKRRKSESQAWKGIRQTWENTVQCLGWKLGDGYHTRFWEDRWLPQFDKLITYASGSIDERSKEEKVGTFVSEEGEWLWEKFSSLLPTAVIHAIAKIKLTGWSGREDKPIWWHTNDGRFSLKSAYLNQNHQREPPRRGLWRKIWKAPVPQRYRQFLWLYGRNRLLTNANRVDRGFNCNSHCCLCGNTREDLMHALRNCTVAAKCWEYIIPSQLHRNFSEMQNLAQWMEWNLSLGCMIKGHPWRAWFAVVSRHIWLNRNAHVFQNKAVGYKQIITQAHAVLSSSEQVPGGTELPPQAANTWKPPHIGCIKINVDGATNQQSMESACAGIARDHDGAMLDGFLFRMNKGPSLHAELWVVLWSLKRAWDLHWRRIVIETDCREVVELLDNGWMDEHQEGILLSEIQRRIEGDSYMRVIWCPREANHVADRMVKYALYMAEGIIFISEPPDFLCTVLQLDIRM